MIIEMSGDPEFILDGVDDDDTTFTENYKDTCEDLEEVDYSLKTYSDESGEEIENEPIDFYSTSNKIGILAADSD